MSKCQGAAERAVQAGPHGADFTPRRTHNEWLQCGVTSKAWSADSDSWGTSIMPASLTLYRQWGTPIVRRFVSHPSSSGADAWEKLSDAKPETDLPIHGSAGKQNVGGRRETKHKVNKERKGGCRQMRVFVEVVSKRKKKKKSVITALGAMNGGKKV